jgi:hypothetical protein
MRDHARAVAACAAGIAGKQSNSRSLTRRTKMPTMGYRGICHLESFVRFPVPQISICVLLVHVVLGCCWHHAHTCDMDCCAQPAPLAEACACGVHHERDLDSQVAHKHGQENSPSEEGRHSQPHQCAGGHCTFLRSQRLAELQSELYSNPLLFDTDPSTSYDVTSAMAQSSQAFSLADRLSVEGPPIRRHLLLHILVI